MILFLEPYFEQKVWAGNTLKSIYDCKDNTGEAWIVSGFKGKSSRIKNGEFKGKTLHYLYNHNKELFGNFPDKDFPVLIKLIDAKDKLSVQVHPDDDYALKTKNQLGKFECWYILNETKNKEIIVGVSASSQKEMRSYIDNNMVEEFMIKRPIAHDDLIIIEPGTVHAILEDTFLLEVQETSDITYRLYDYNRKPLRELHIDDALNVIKFNDKTNPVHPFKDEKTYKNDYFNFHKLIVNGVSTYENKGFEIFYVISGNCVIDGESIKQGDTFILTDTLNQFQVSGTAELIAIVPKPKKKERMKMRKIALITGIVGQDGSYLTDFLLNKGYEVHGVIQSYSQLNHSSMAHLVNNKSVMDETLFFHIGDMTDSSNLNRIIESVKPDEIYHLASQSHVDISFDVPEYTTEVNCLGTLRILDAIKQSGIKTKMFNLSSCLMFGGDTVPQNENTPFNPKNPYAVSKLYAYYMVKNYRDNYGIYACNGIMFSHDSPRREPSFVSQKIVQAVKRIASGEDYVLSLGNIMATREWAHAKDYSEAMWLMLQQEKPEDFVISVEEAHTVKEFVEKAFLYKGFTIKWVGKDFNLKGYDLKTNKLLVNIDKQFFRIKDHDVMLGDAKKFREATGFKATTSFDELIKDMFEAN